MNKRALIVEDEIFVALDLERILLDAGYTVSAIAADTASAIEGACGCQFAFIDINLRDGSTGPAIARRIADEHGVRVVFVTANPGQIGEGAAALAYVRKPFSEATILAAAALASGDPAMAEDDALVPIVVMPSATERG